MLSVFGGTGFIGGNFCKLYGDQTAIIPRDQRVTNSQEIVYFISTTSNYNVFEDPSLDINTNLIVLSEVLHNLKQMDKKPVFNFISSWFVYGETDLPAKETACCNPKGFYSITKHCAENLVESYCKTFDISYRILRLSNVYGKNDMGVSKKKNALQYLISELKKNKDISLYHGGDFIRDYIYVDDACRAIKIIIEKGNLNEIYNIGSGMPYTFKNIIDRAAKIIGSKSKIESINPPKFHEIVQVKDMFLDTSKLKDLGFREAVSIEEGIQKLCLV